MPKVLIVYYSHGGNTRKMAEPLSEAIKAEGLEVELKKVANASPDDLIGVDGLLMGSPTYFMNVAGPMKIFIDETFTSWSKGILDGKPGGVFSSAGVAGGGGELALLGLMYCLLSHGMVTQGYREWGHLGPLAFGEPDQAALDWCEKYGRRFADLVKRLAE